MHPANRTWLAWRLAGLLVVPVFACAQSSPAAQESPRAVTGVVDGGAGPCTADFVVNDAAGKGIYGVKIDIEIRYGLFGAHRVGVTINTDSLGKARIEGLPEKIKGTAEFKLSYLNQNKSLAYDPLADCHSHHQVVLTEK